MSDPKLKQVKYLDQETRLFYETTYNETKTHCVYSVQIGSLFWSVFSHIRTEYGPEKNSVFGHFSRSDKHMSTLLILLIDLWLKFQSYKNQAIGLSSKSIDRSL